MSVMPIETTPKPYSISSLHSVITWWVRALVTQETDLRHVTNGSRTSIAIGPV